MPRLFAGIDFPDTAKRDLSRLCDGMPGARWVDPRKFHLTLRFIGEVADPAAAEIAAALGRVKAPVFALALAGVGHFRQHNLWAGIAPNPALLALQAEIEQALRQIGLPADERRYVPHVKLARLTRRQGMRAYLSRHADFRTAPFTVKQFSLIESHPDTGGTRYEHKADYPLG